MTERPSDSAPRVAIAQALDARSGVFFEEALTLADIALDALRSLPAHERMEAMGMVPQVLRLAGQRAWVEGPDVH